ncbi:bifunctional hydroxymethylpyrimidine kinase/phosphomethylpyrimidine kinase [Cognatilysobacter lacus]|uniref:hydroxymethylpyrimidine kinase n=1 Tax=Cognatilysobacter lacus TaxID=1643323 RepID=A0A5D8Z713_9GAMM|nr:bifunctional hydroxymethylpyrimidine kinase/phosphomethylpyrimidine kinase [Lysobacter lacus]TZF90579.1 bifunctional hydroxymethylpyrimidine kinase/phosphomethylpyrimidine kinase [Lysobacter lacus]
MTISVLTIAGSDSGGGAGIQADLKTFAAHRVHGLSAITALTAQNTLGVTGVAVTDAAFIAEQIDACFADFDVGAVKLGMLANAEVIHAVSDALERHHPVPVVVDPVMIATSGACLLDPGAVSALLDRLLPIAAVLTPNVPEAEVLLGRHIIDTDDALDAARAIVARGCRGVLLKGGHLRGGRSVVDVLAMPGGRAERFKHARLDVRAHGTGCTLASAIAAHLALGHSLAAACAHGTDYVHRALSLGYRPGRGRDVTVLDHFAAAR